MRRRSLVVAALLVFGACGSGESLGAEDAIRAYFDAWNTRDVDLIMSLVADGAELEIDPAGVIWTDRADMRVAFESMFVRSDWTIEVSNFQVDGDSATYNYEIFGPDGTVLERGRSRALVEDGLIKSERSVGAYQP